MTTGCDLMRACITHAAAGFADVAPVLDNAAVSQSSLLTSELALRRLSAPGQRNGHRMFGGGG